jgi:hypothetical protein
MVVTPGGGYRKLDSAIVVMKAADQRMRCDASEPLNRARQGRVLVSMQRVATVEQNLLERTRTGRSHYD